MAQIVLGLYEEEERNFLKIARRTLRDASEPFSLPEERFVELIRLSKDEVHYLINSIRDYLPLTKYCTAIPMQLKVCAALRYFATGSYQRTIGQDYLFGLSQTSVCRVIADVTAALSEIICAEWVIFPQNDGDILRTQEGFMNQGFPGCVGAIDGTHVAILKPRENEHLYLNRKGYYSINVQIICDSTLRILNINARYPGSTHDAFIWRNSNIKQYLQQHTQGEIFWLIGDSGYPLQPFLMTPIIGALQNSPEDRYNTAHSSARNCVERCIGVLKNRFRCLLKENVRRYEPAKVGIITNVCAALHNMALADGIELNININDVNDIDDIIVGANARIEGQHVRQRIIQDYYI